MCQVGYRAVIQMTFDYCEQRSLCTRNSISFSIKSKEIMRSKSELHTRLSAQIFLSIPSLIMLGMHSQFAARLQHKIQFLIPTENGFRLREISNQRSEDMCTSLFFNEIKIQYFYDVMVKRKQKMLLQLNLIHCVRHQFEQTEYTNTKTGIQN